MLQDLIHTMFFKATFDIKTNSDQDALWELIREIRYWLQKKAERDNYELAWDNKTWTQIKAGDLIKSNDETVVLRSCMHVENNVYTWACKVIEDRDTSNKYAPRQWITEIGFRGETISKGCVSLVLSYIDRPGFIGPLQSEPNVTTPGIIKLLLNSNKMQCSVSGIHVSTEATQIQNALDTFKLIANPERSIPVIVIAPTLSGRLLITPNDLSKMLGPNALVLYTNSNCLLEELNSYLDPYELHCLPGALRIYRDKLDLNKPDEMLRHRYISSKFIAEVGEDEVLHILRRALAQDVYFWQKMLRIEDVKRLNRNASREKDLRARYQDEALDDMLELERAKEESELFAEQILEEKEDLAAQKHDLESRYKSLMQSFNQMRQSSASIASDLHKHMASMSKLPSTPSEIANLAKHVFRDRIDFTEKRMALP